MRIVIRYTDPNDMPQFITDSAEAQFLSICEFTPRDRVYELTQVVERVSVAEMDALISDSRIGRLGDMPGAEAKIARYLAGEPEPKKGSHLTVVEP